VLDVSERGVQATIDEGQPAFWLPRHHPAVEWSSSPEPGAIVSVKVPMWLVAKHDQLRARRHQSAFALYAPDAGQIDPSKEMPVADHPDDIGDGVLFKNRDKTKSSQPDYFGRAKIEGRELRVAAWIRESKKSPGQKYMALSFREAIEQPAKPEPSGGWRDRDEAIPFGPAR
jgi:hypothetical protein